MNFCQHPSFHNPPVGLSVPSRCLNKGFLSTERNIAWICSNDYLYSINRDDGACLQLWKCDYGIIHGVHDVIYGDTQFLVVTVYAGNDGYIIALLHASSFDIVKLISLSDRCTSVSGFESPCITSKMLISNGNLVIGCNGGNVFFINFNLNSNSYEPVNRPKHIEVVEEYESIQDDKNSNFALLLTRGMYTYV